MSASLEAGYFHETIVWVAFSWQKSLKLDSGFVRGGFGEPRLSQRLRYMAEASFEFASARLVLLDRPDDVFEWGLADAESQCCGQFRAGVLKRVLGCF